VQARIEARALAQHLDAIAGASANQPPKISKIELRALGQKALGQFRHGGGVGMPEPRAERPARIIRVYFDGSHAPSRAMGYGCVIRDGEAELWRHSAVSIPEEWNGATSNNLAEYLGLMAALRYLLDAGLEHRDIEVLGDRQLVIRQPFGHWRIKKGACARLTHEAKALLRSFSCVRGTWVPRERNRLADMLSKAALTDAAVTPRAAL
jgi:ribonuclease HI